MRQIQAENRLDSRTRRLDVLCKNLNATMTSVDEIEKVTRHMYIIRKADGSICPSNLMVGNILYDMGNRVKEHGKFLMHTARVFNIKCAEVSLRLKKEDDDDIEILRVVHPKRVDVVRAGTEVTVASNTEECASTSPVQGTLPVPVKKEASLDVNEREPVDMSLQTDEATRNKMCAICNKHFSRKHLLQEHLNRHSGTTFQCSKCDRSFFSPERHADHFRLHKGELTCNECGKVFTTSGKLSMHKRFHESKRYLCRKPQCSRSFVLKGDRDEHEGDHDLKGTYDCDYCDKSFVTKSGVKSHVSMHRRLEKM